MLQFQSSLILLAWSCDAFLFNCFSPAISKARMTFHKNQIPIKICEQKEEHTFICLLLHFSNKIEKAGNARIK